MRLWDEGRTECGRLCGGEVGAGGFMGKRCALALVCGKHGGEERRGGGGGVRVRKYNTVKEERAKFTSHCIHQSPEPRTISGFPRQRSPSTTLTILRKYLFSTFGGYWPPILQGKWDFSPKSLKLSTRFREFQR